MFKTFLEAVDAQEDKVKLKEFKKLLQAAYTYGDRNLESDWAEGSVLYALKEAIEHADKLKGK